MKSLKITKSKKKFNGQEMVEWWFIISLISFLVMFSLLNWGSILNTTMNHLNKTLQGVNENINGST